MSLISTKTHTIFDYATGVLLVASPWIFEFHDGSAAPWMAIINGMTMLLLSVFTNYEGGIFRVISMKTHLTVDTLAGLVLAFSPWIFGFRETVMLPHLLLGLMQVLVGLATDRTPFPLGKEMFRRTAHNY
ncbi:SPW repeat domain-containing protein [Chitinophaga rhizophila]|uniref:SPW repeat protein n=1 Tax=Chitinophaga rhizophila TaxID=2866212 RepID=A0ABS7G6F8_9BACT|nr:SPW repeat protein [Chitinophaga rhizophila]MBW8682745.1 SPW repeat protein [Chitinophaga rhizophila]